MSYSLALAQDFQNNRRDQVVVSGLSRVEQLEEFNSTRSKVDIVRATREVESTISSTLASEGLKLYALRVLQGLRTSYLDQRNCIINSLLKSLFYKKKLRQFDSILEDIDYKIYLLESDSTKKLIRLGEKKLEEDSAYLTEIKKKYSDQ